MYELSKPYEEGHLDVGDGQNIYYALSGNPDGKPAVFVHGGPGGGAPLEHTCFFNPEKYKIIRFDQRGCGNSTPRISDRDVDLEANLAVNTTQNLVADIEKLREHLGIERWLVFGGSWGSTLSLAYAEAHPDRVTELVLRGIFLLRRTELDFYYNGGAAHIFPDKWESYLAPIPEDKKPPRGDIHGRTHLEGVDLIAEFHKLLMGDDYDKALEAAIAWSTWEGATSHLYVPDEPDYSEPEYALTFARIENHYFYNGAFMEDGELIKQENIDKIRHIPATIVQGRYDVVCPAISAWQLHQAWPEADFHLSPASGHASREEENVAALVAATDKYAEQ